MIDYIIHTDGGSRGNPGPAAIGIIIADGNGKVLKEYGDYIGKTTNNDAEYSAIISALQKLKALSGKTKTKQATVKVFMDSELIVKQITGIYKVENESMQKLFIKLWNLKIDFKNVEFEAIKREKNKEADRMVNEALDAELGKRTLL